MNKIEINNYYNSEKWLNGKIKEFVYGNKRIDKCLELLSTQITNNHKTDICEVGCSIGLTSYQIAQTYPLVNIHGYDIADEQVNLANKIFKTDRTKFSVHDFMSPLQEQFDIVTLFDVFEHIPISKRKIFIENIGMLLKDKGRIIMTVPSHFSTSYNIINRKDLLQIVDEVVQLNDLIDFALYTNTCLSYYALVSIWNRHDYAHVIFDREKPLQKNDPPLLTSSIIRKIKIKLGIDPFKSRIRSRKKLIKEKMGISV